MTHKFEAAIVAAERAWNNHYLAGEVEQFATLLHGDFRYVSERGTFDRQHYLSNLKSGEIEMQGLKTIHSDTRIYGDIAIVTGVVSMQAKFQGKDISGDDDYTRVWQLQDGRPIALTQHASGRSKP